MRYIALGGLVILLVTLGALFLYPLALTTGRYLAGEAKKVWRSKK